MDAERIRRQMQEVAVGHYRGFISAADAVQSISQEIAAVDEHLENLVSFCRIPALLKLLAEMTYLMCFKIVVGLLFLLVLCIFEC